MSAPVPIPGRIQPHPWSAEAYAHAERPTWCTECEIHIATAAKPLCPVCLDDDVKHLGKAS
jgi:hypothetical protein